jgi:hypothetical protein
LPFEDESFDRVLSAVALHYMNIQKTLAEIHRVLVPGGGLSLSLHLPSFTIAELLHNAIPKPVPTLFRLYVMANGLVFHCTGRTVGFVNRKTESFQTEREMRVTLNRAGFVNLSFRRPTGPVGETFIVEARKSKAIGPFAAVRAAQSQGWTSSVEDAEEIGAMQRDQVKGILPPRASPTSRPTRRKEISVSRTAEAASLLPRKRLDLQDSAISSANRSSKMGLRPASWARAPAVTLPA